ncbi:MAG: hypothetical protein QXI37_03465 [Thermoprotei archaeon]
MIVYMDLLFTVFLLVALLVAGSALNAQAKLFENTVHAYSTQQPALTHVLEQCATYTCGQKLATDVASVCSNITLTENVMRITC